MVIELTHRVLPPLLHDSNSSLSVYYRSVWHQQLVHVCLFFKYSFLHLSRPRAFSLSRLNSRR